MAFKPGSDRTAGVIGLGAMGRPMANRLIGAGYDVVCFDVSEEAVKRLVADGAQSAASPRELARDATFVLTMLPEAAQVRETLLGPEGAIHGLREGAVVMDASTVDPFVAYEVADALGPKGVRTLDAGVSGSAQMAWDGTFTLMVGGPEEALAHVRLALETLCGKLVYTGRLGTAKAVKLANNMVSAVTMAALAEAFSMALRSGVRPAVLREAMMGSWARCANLEHRPPTPGAADDSPADRGYEPDFTVDYIIKDLGYMLRTAGAYRSFASLAALTQQLYTATSGCGYGDRDLSAIGRMMEDLSHDMPRA